MIRKLAKKYKSLFNDVDLISTGENSNIGKRISLVSDKIKSDNFLLLNGDAIFNFNLKRIFNNHIKKKIWYYFYRLWSSIKLWNYWKNE